MEFSAEQVETKEGEFWMGCRQLGSNPRSIPRGMSDVCWEILITTYLKGENCSRAALVLRFVKQLRQGTGSSSSILSEGRHSPPTGARLKARMLVLATLHPRRNSTAAAV